MYIYIYTKQSNGPRITRSEGARITGSNEVSRCRGAEVDSSGAVDGHGDADAPRWLRRVLRMRSVGASQSAPFDERIRLIQT